MKTWIVVNPRRMECRLDVTRQGRQVRVRFIEVGRDKVSWEQDIPGEDDVDSQLGHVYRALVGRTPRPLRSRDVQIVGSLDAGDIYAGVYQVGTYVILDAAPSSRLLDKEGKPLTRGEWSQLFEKDEYRQIAADELPGCLVSTIWIGDDVRGRVFESKVFNTKPTGPYTPPIRSDVLDERRYSTLAEAQAGHAELLAMWGSSTEGA